MLVTALSNNALREIFGERLQEKVILAPYTSARIGGPADYLIDARSADELAEIVTKLWNAESPFIILGGGSNILFSDLGVRGVVVLNRAKAVRFDEGDQPAVWCESGAVLSNVAHRTVAQGLGGLEWAATVPGTVGGAVYGNAGAFESDIAHDLIRTDILDETGRNWWSVEKLEYGYRTSVLKRLNKKAIILSAEFRLILSTMEETQSRMEQFSAKRKATQPPGASMGSMFKNPTGDHAGRLIEASGLKGKRIGNAEISKIHGNFFINTGDAKATDVKALIDLARKTVKEKTGVDLELEIELAGEWK
jgi:UDP-N-acetylmuramate dehydrogenase